MTIKPRHVNLRLTYELHHDLEFIAQICGISLNQLLVNRLQNVVTDTFAEPEFHDKINKWMEEQKKTADRIAEEIRTAVPTATVDVPATIL